MGRKSKVSRLPRELREALLKQFNTGLYTAAELKVHIDEIAPQYGVDAARVPSQSGLQRYFKNFEATAKRMRQAREIASGILDKIGGSPQGDVARLIMEMFATLSFSQLHRLEEETAKGAVVKPMELMLLGKMVRDVMSAEKTWADREIRVREKLRDEANRKIAAAEQTADGVMRRAGLSKEAAEAIRAAMRGARV